MQKTGAFILKPSHTRLLRSVHFYYFLTIGQLTGLHYKSTSLTYVRELCKELVDAGYLARFHIPRATQAGSTASIFFLAKKGIEHLQTLGGDVADRARISEKHELERNFHFVYHTLAVNDILIAARLLSMPDIHLASMLHERTLKLLKLPVIPDGWLDFHLTKTKERVCIWLEVDRATIEERPFKRKLRNMLAYVDSDEYTADFETTSCVVAFIVAKGGQARLKRVLQWTRSELSAMEQSDMILFTSLEQNEREPNKLALIDPTHIFCDPIWQSPFAEECISLLL